MEKETPIIVLATTDNNMFDKVIERTVYKTLSKVAGTYFLCLGVYIVLRSVSISIKNKKADIESSVESTKESEPKGE